MQQLCLCLINFYVENHIYYIFLWISYFCDASNSCSAKPFSAWWVANSTNVSALLGSLLFKRLKRALGSLHQLRIVLASENQVPMALYQSLHDECRVGIMTRNRLWLMLSSGHNYKRIITMLFVWLYAMISDGPSIVKDTFQFFCHLVTWHR